MYSEIIQYPIINRKALRDSILNPCVLERLIGTLASGVWMSWRRVLRAQQAARVRSAGPIQVSKYAYRNFNILAVRIRLSNFGCAVQYSMY